MSSVIFLCVGLSFVLIGRTYLFLNSMEFQLVGGVLILWAAILAVYRHQKKVKKCMQTVKDGLKPTAGEEEI